MKIIVLLLSLIAFNFANARSLAPVVKSDKDILYCSFTEPFFSITFDAQIGSVIYTGVEAYDPVTETFIPRTLSSNGRLVPVVQNGESTEHFYSVQGSVFELQDENNITLMTLTLDMNGSDGMSDVVYPFSAIYDGHIGGCYTDKYPAIDTIDIYEGLIR